MGNPAYDARREAERLEAEQEIAFALAGKAAFEALTSWLQGNATISISPNPMGIGGWNIRLILDAKHE